MILLVNWIRRIQNSLIQVVVKMKHKSLVLKLSHLVLGIVLIVHLFDNHVTHKHIGCIGKNLIVLVHIITIPLLIDDALI